MPPLARLISLGILTTLIVALGITFYQVLAPFLLPLFLAWVTAILCRPLYLWACRKTNGRPRLAAGLTTAGLLLVVLLPLVLGTVFAAAQLVELATTTIGNRQWRERVTSLLDDPRVQRVAQSPWVEPYLAPLPEEPGTAARDPLRDDPAYRDDDDPFAEPIDEGRVKQPLDPDQIRERIETSLRETLITIGGRTIGSVGIVPGFALGALGVLGRVVSLLVALVMFAIGLYYFLCDGPELVLAAESLIPVRVDYQQELLRRFDEVVRAVVLSTFLSALAQGFLTAVALGVAGFDHLFVFFVVASLAAMIPLAGTWLVWGPCAVWLAWHEQAYGTAGLLAAFGVLVIGFVDNVIRTYILNSNAKLHPLLAFVSVLGGLQVMGLWGVFIAPVVAACLHALMQIFNAELKAFSHERTAVRQANLDEAVSPPVVPPPAEPTLPAPPATSKEVVRREASKTVARPVTTGAKGGKRRRR